MSVGLWAPTKREKPDREPACEVDMEGPITPDEIQQAQLSLMQRAGAFLVTAACLGAALALIVGE